MRTPVELPYNVHVEERANMDRQLDDAVEIVREFALVDGQKGIVVTRHSNHAFTVDLSDAVPFGFTMEQDAVSSN